MKRSSKRVLVMTVALVLCAGLVVGRLSARLVPPAPFGFGPPGNHSPSWLQDQLNLTSEQKQQMDSIWADTKSQIGKTWDGRHELEKQRDDAIHSLLTSQQQTEYAKIYDDYHAKRQELDRQRDDLIKTAEDKSRALLSDSQKARWDVLTKEMHDHRGPHGPGDHGGDHGPGDHGDGGDHGGPPHELMDRPPTTSPSI
jgi:Spy/CpxP family protein refolding chaperone